MCVQLLRLPNSAKNIWCSWRLSTFSVLLPLLCCSFCARTAGRKRDAEQVSEYESERALIGKCRGAAYGMRDAQPRRQRGEEESIASERSISPEVRCAIV